jgi:hypothetical protein
MQRDEWAILLETQLLTVLKQPVIVVSDIAPKIAGDRPKLHRMQRAFRSALEKTKISLLHRSVLSSACTDFEAATVTTLQHFCYQKRLFLPPEKQEGGKFKRKHSGISRRTRN